MERIRRKTLQTLGLLFVLVLMIVFVANVNLLTGNVVYNGLVSSKDASQINASEKSNNFSILIFSTIGILSALLIYFKIKK